jgi:hypothetical protein
MGLRLLESQRRVDQTPHLVCFRFCWPRNTDGVGLRREIAKADYRAATGRPIGTGGPSDTIRGLLPSSSRDSSGR